MTAQPSLSAFLATFLKIGVLSFGGPAAQLAVMQRLVIEERGWVSEREFLSAMSFCMLLPGPEAMQLSTWLGWRLRGTSGGVIAGVLFVLPGALVMLALAAVYALFGGTVALDTVFSGVKAAVIAVVIAALVRLTRKAVTTRLHAVLAVLAFAAMFAFGVPFPLVILCAAAVGFGLSSAQHAEPLPQHGHASWQQTVKTAAVWTSLWWGPLLLVAFFAPGGLLWQVGQFFSTVAVLSFGGAYAVLAWLAQDAVVQFQWLSTEQMVDGLGLAETTPGPLILVTEFVAFLAGFGQGGLALAVAAAGVALWATFLPCFLWIFAGAPWLAWVCNQPRLSGALSAITAAVVGVMLNLSVWFALHVLFENIDTFRFAGATLLVPDWLSVDWRALGLFALSAVAVFRWKWGVLSVLALACAASSVIAWLV